MILSFENLSLPCLFKKVNYFQSAFEPKKYMYRHSREKVLIEKKYDQKMTIIKIEMPFSVIGFAKCNKLITANSPSF